MARKKIEEPMEQVEAQAMAVQPDKKQRKPRETKSPKSAVMKAQEPVKEGKIGRADVQRALDILRRYKDGKAMLESRAVENEQWWKLRHWSTMSSESKDSRFESAWLFNMLLNKHADAMDNYPEAVILPREEKDMEAAWELSEIVPVVMDMNGMEEVYDKAWWSKLKNGTGIYGVFWNSRKENGLGDIEVREIDVLNVYWEPGVEDIQNSPNFCS